MKSENKILTPIKAIRAKCLDCSNNQYKEVRLCPIKKCALYPTVWVKDLRMNKYISRLFKFKTGKLTYEF